MANQSRMLNKLIVIIYSDSLGKRMHILDHSKEEQEMRSKRDVTSEIDYSDHKSAMGIVNKFGNRKLHSRATSILTNENLK